MGKPYKSGMFGGKFLPLHKGHALCISVALALCDEVHVILFPNGDGELEALRGDTVFPKEKLTVESRVAELKRLLGDDPRLHLHVVDVMDCKKPDGTEDWDAETPLVLAACGRFDAVFSSEPSYDAYFRSAYPWAKHIIIDPERKRVPISATLIRGMTEDEAREWLSGEGMEVAEKALREGTPENE
jgi:HTH-type transcriptional repressor of NAD biosynthesis genes